MPWWFWIVLWAVLLVGTVAASVVGGFWLVRKVLRVMHEAGASLAGLGASSVEGRIDEIVEGDVCDSPKPGSAVLADPDLMRVVYEQGRAVRKEERRARRVARRSQRGQPQSLRDLGLI